MIVTNFSFNEICQTQTTVLLPGIYKFELWGAKGGGTYAGNGGFSSGTIFINSPTKFYINVGGKGEAPDDQNGGKGGCNGGGDGGNGTIYEGEPVLGGYGGGGATDIRIASNNISDRIIVAGGGGGQTMSDEDNKEGDKYRYTGAGGGISGENGRFLIGSNLSSPGATQSTGNENGAGSNGRNGRAEGPIAAEGGGGGGGGYLGGLTHTGTKDHSNLPGGGGSGYVSGHPEALHHHPLIQFRSPVTKRGNESGVISPDKDGNGFVSITLISYIHQTNQLMINHHFIFFVIFIGHKL